MCGNMRMYILVKGSIPLGYSVVAVAHSSLICHLKYNEDLEYKKWLDSSFKKVVCVVSDKDFEKAKSFEDFVIVTESALDNTEVALVFKPREEYPKFFKYLKLLK